MSVYRDRDTRLVHVALSSHNVTETQGLYTRFIIQCVYTQGVYNVFIYSVVLSSDDMFLPNNQITSSVNS